MTTMTAAGGRMMALSRMVENRLDCEADHIPIRERKTMRKAKDGYLQHMAWVVVMLAWVLGWHSLLPTVVDVTSALHLTVVTV